MIRVTEKLKERICLYMEENRENMINLLEEIVRIPSVMGEARQGAPFGGGPARMLEKAAEILEKEGFAAKREDAYVLASVGEGETSIGIFAHGDVVPPGEGWALTEPFSPVIRDGFMIGRGTSDNKAGFVEMLYAAKAIRELGLPIKSRLALYMGSNEESGMEDVKAFAAHEEMPTASIVPDGTYPYVCGEKGRIVLYLENKSAFSFIKEMHGGDSVNRVMDFAEARMPFDAAVFDALLEKEGIFVTKTDGEMIISAKGIPAHASTPQNGDNAFTKLANVLLACEALPEDDRAILKEAVQFTSGIYGEGFSIQREDAAFGKLTNTNGIAKTENGYLSLSFDIRFGGSFCTEIMEKLGHLINWSVRPEDVSDGYLRDKAPVGQALGKVYDNFTGKGEKGITMGIGTYARHLENAFPTGICVRTKKGLSLPVGHGEAHQADEFLEIDGFIIAAAILTCMILETDAVISK